jgi:hypothetical protein
MIVVDADPNNDGNVTDAKIAGSVLLTGNYSILERQNLKQMMKS